MCAAQDARHAAHAGLRADPGQLRRVRPPADGQEQQPALRLQRGPPLALRHRRQARLSCAWTGVAWARARPSRACQASQGGHSSGPWCQQPHGAAQVPGSMQRPVQGRPGSHTGACMLLRVPDLAGAKGAPQHHALQPTFESPPVCRRQPAGSRTEARARWFELPALQIFHTINAWQEGPLVRLFTCYLPKVRPPWLWVCAPRSPVEWEPCCAPDSQVRKRCRGGHGSWMLCTPAFCSTSQAASLLSEHLERSTACWPELHSKAGLTTGGRSGTW